MSWKSAPRLLLGISLLPLFACAPETPGTTMDEAGDGAASEWIVLFDGTDLSHWRGYRQSDPPQAWSVDGDVLAFNPGAPGGDLLTREQFGDFELELQWRLSEGGNSGILYRATEDYENVWESAPEMQVLDDARHADGQNPLTSAGANYALYPASADVVRPVGEWNQVRIVAQGNHVEHWLNGQKVVEYELGSPDWQERVAASKFATMPGYGRALRGHIALQDHGDPVWYRDIRIRPLDGRE
jgi:hypothetical protein